MWREEEGIERRQHICNILILDFKALLCDFHREQAWERWKFKKENGVADNRECLLALTGQFARARTEDLYENALKKLKNKFDRNTKKNFKN